MLHKWRDFQTLFTIMYTYEILEIFFSLYFHLLESSEYPSSKKRKLVWQSHTEPQLRNHVRFGSPLFGPPAWWARFEWSRRLMVPKMNPIQRQKRSYILFLIQRPCSPAPSSWLGVAQVGSSCQMVPRRPFIYPHHPRNAKHIPSIYSEYSQYIPRILYHLYSLANQYTWLLTITNDNKS